MAPILQPEILVVPQDIKGPDTKRRLNGRVERVLEALAQKMTRWVSGSHGFVSAVAAVALWLAAGPLVGFSTGWHLVLTSATAIATFLMVFLIQRSQTKEALALQLKLNEVIAALEGASNRLMAAEHMTESELEDLSVGYRDLRTRAQGKDEGQALSIDRAQGRGGPDAPRKPSG